MKTKKQLTAIARKAWRTRRRNSKVGAKAVKGERKYSKKVRHLAALRAWRTRREKVVETIDPDVLVFSSDPIRKNVRHDAAMKAWRTRRANKK